MEQASLPRPAEVHSYGELAAALQELRVRAGVSYRELHRRVGRRRRSRRVPEIPAYDTVYRCLQPGRARLDPELVADIAWALGAEVEAWQQVCRLLARPGPSTGAVLVGDLPERQPMVGREPELAKLAAKMASGQVPVCLITGMAGIGKTFVAVESAHRFVLARRPAGVAYLDLQGFDPVRAPVAADDAIGPLLRRLGAPADRVAAAGAERRRTWLRALLQREPWLLVLDDARDEAQLAPLLPGPAAASRVLVTSRRRLDLGAAGAGSVELSVLGSDDAAGLLAAARGPGAADGDTAQLAELAELAGRLPLALSILASRLAARTGWTLADHVDQVRAMQAEHRLEAGVEASLRLSYADLSGDDQRLLRLVSQLPVAGFDQHLAAAVSGLPLDVARSLLEQLVRSHLIRALGDGRHDLHDTVRTFLAARSLEEDPPRIRRHALDRLYAYQVAATAAARVHYDPSHEPTELASAEPVPSFTDRAAASGWLQRERADLLAGAFSALDHGRPERAVRLSALLFGFLLFNQYADDAARLYSRVAAATSGAEHAGALLSLGAAHGSAGRLAQARAPLEQALAVYSELGHDQGVAKSLHNLGTLCWELGDYPAADDYYRRAFALGADGPAGVAMTVDNVGQLCARLGRYGEAQRHHEQALALHRQLGDRLKEGRTLSSLGALAVRAGRSGEARTLLAAGLAISHELGDRIGEFLTRSRLAELDSLAGRHARAVDAQRSAAAAARACVTTEEAREVLLGLAAAHRRSGQLTAAGSAQAEALSTARAAGDPYWIARALAEGAELAACRADQPAAQHQWSEAAELFERLGCPEAVTARANRGRRLGARGVSRT